MKYTGESRRSFLRLGGAALVVGTGCTFRESDVQDSDGDGVIDSQDYAPRDPDVQSRRDVEMAGSGEDRTATDREPTETDREPTAAPSSQQLVAQSGSSGRGTFTVNAPGVVGVGQPFLLIGGVAEAETEQFGAFEAYVDGRLVHSVGLQEGQAALFTEQYRIARPETRTFTVEVRFVNGDENVDERVGQVQLDVRARRTTPEQLPGLVNRSGSSDRGRFSVGCPSLVPPGAQFPVAGRVTEASTEQYGAFEVYVDGTLVRDAGLQEGESARFGRLYGMPSSGSRRFGIEVRFVNGDFDVDERVGRTTLTVGTV
jgi:hypothetical protein